MVSFSEENHTKPKRAPARKGLRGSWVRALLIGTLTVTVAGCSLFQGEEPEGRKPPLERPTLVDPWIEIDSRSETLTVHRPGREPVTLRELAFGAAGVKEKRRMGDDVTPRGTYTIGWIRTESKFVHFIGLNYPSLADADRGLASGVIHRGAYERIKRAHAAGATPPQDTPLGGFIGIHGVGRGSMEIHRLANWTAGCIAIDNQQIRKLRDLIHIGMRVEIK